MSKNNNCSPISVIDSEQMMIIGCREHTALAYRMYKNLINSSYEYKYYAGKKYDCCTYQRQHDMASYILLKSYYKNIKGVEDCCLSSRVMDNYECEHSICDYRQRYIGKQYGIVPTIPYKYVYKTAKKLSEKFGNDNCYALGYYPSKMIDFNEKQYRIDFVDELHYIKDNERDILPKESDFIITDDTFSFPIIIDDKLELENYNVYKATTEKGIEIKAIKYNDKWFRIEPVVWELIGENLVCTKILFESPVHMKNDYIQNGDIQSLNDTFVKWYIDNIFTKDLFKYTDMSFMKEQISLAIDEDIDIKLKEIERLKQMKANLILQQQIKGTAQRNILNFFEENSKEQTVKTLHK
jgi:hypothetical protein